MNEDSFTIEQIKSVMIIDDDKMDLFIATKVVQNLNKECTIHTFTNPLLALEYFKLVEDGHKNYRLFSPQIIFLDINMPFMNGFQFLDEFAKFKILKTMPIKIFVLSSTSNTVDIERVNKNEIHCTFIQKPLTVEVLKKMLKTG